MAMALPTIFAACSSDELEAIQNGDNALDSRIELGNVELAFGDDAQTRMSAEGGVIKFLVDDGVGACLVDNYVHASDKAGEEIKNYQLTSTIQTNYQYKYDGSTWATTARMVEGNYVFYAPYNGNHLSRAPLNTGVPAVQELAMGANGKLDQFSIIDAFVKSGAPAYVGYKFLKAEGQTTKVKVDMKPIFAYPLITFTNDKTGTDAGDVTITKFVIIQSNGFATEMPMAIGKANAVASNKATGIVGSLFDETAKDTEKGAWITNKFMIGNKTGNVTGTATKTANMITINVPEGALKVAQGESVKFNVVLPADAAKKYTVYAYLDNGKAYSMEMNAGFSAGKIYPDNQYKTDGTTLATAATAGTMSTKKMSAPSAAPVVVTSTEELVNLIAGAVENVTDIEVSGSNVKITKEVVDAANPTLTYNFKSAVAIAAGKEAVELKNFEFGGNVTVESGDVTYNNKAKIEAVVEKDAKLTVLEAENTSEVETKAGAKAVIGGSKATDSSVTVATLKNAGETTINVKGTVTDVEENKGTIINESAALPTSIVGKWVNNGNVKLAKATTIAAEVANTTPAGELTNNGSIETNGCNLTIEEGAVLDNAAEGMLVNGSASSEVVVNGTLEAHGLFKGNAIGTASGRINLYSGYQAANDFSLPTGTGILADVMDSYDATATEKPNLTANANMLSVKDLTVAAVADLGKAKYELQDKGTMNVKGNIALEEATEITTKGDATITGIYALDGTTGKVLTITVAEEKTLTLKGITLGADNFTELKGKNVLKPSKYKLTAGATLGTSVVASNESIEEAE